MEPTTLDEWPRGEGSRDNGANGSASKTGTSADVASRTPPSAQNPISPAVRSLFGLEDGDDPESSGADQESVTSPVYSTFSSPSVTSPPYWMTNQSHMQGHHRIPSNMSSESVLPPGAITLQDNEYDDGPDGSNVYGRDRNRACWARSVEVKDYVIVNGSTTNIGAFVVWNIRVETLNGSYMNIRKRYSEFDDLRKKLVQTFPDFEAAVPVLPPKNFIAKFRPKFLEKRRAGLQYFLNCIMLNPEFSGSPVLKEFLFS